MSPELIELAKIDVAAAINKLLADPSPPGAARAAPAGKTKRAKGKASKKP